MTMPDIKKDNRGATLLIVMAVFLVLSVVAANVLMMINAGTKTVNSEIDATQRELMIMSIYDKINDKIVAGELNEAFVVDEITTTEFNGFRDEHGQAIPVSMEVEVSKNSADVRCYVTYESSRYCLYAQYSYLAAGGNVTIVKKEVKGVSLAP